jgi:iron(III) transport system ATP-binding protein
VLSLSKLNVSYQSSKSSQGKLQIIDDLELEVNTGEIVALFGPSGGGKSTILKAISGLLENVSGDVFIGGKQVMGTNINIPAEQRQIGLIFQDYALFPHLTVAQNVAFGLDKLTKVERQTKVDSLLTLIKMSEYAGRYPHELSGGQQQRIAIVRALACEPELLLFDESFSNIDPQFRFELISDIRTLLKQHNIAALFVTHNQDEAFAFCDKIAVLHQGKIEQIAPAEQLFNSPKTRFVAEFLGQGLWLPCTVKSSDTLHSELGNISYAGDIDLLTKINSTVDVYIRPHQLKLTLSADSDIVVKFERFVGEFYQSHLFWNEQNIIVKSRTSFLNKHIKIEVDTPVWSIFS